MYIHSHACVYHIHVYFKYIMIQINIRPTMEKSHSGWARMGRIPTFEYWQVLNPALLGLQSTHILV